MWILGKGVRALRSLGWTESDLASKTLKFCSNSKSNEVDTPPLKGCINQSHLNLMLL
jgi:hypothetical protein